jgi:hypothetical protein
MLLRSHEGGDSPEEYSLSVFPLRRLRAEALNAFLA